MTRWIIEKSKGFTKTGLVRISESVRAYAYLVLSSQASARSSILGNDSSSLTAQRVFMNNFDDIVNRRVNIQEDIKRYQDTLNYASSKVDYSVGEGLYMLPSDMNLNIKSGVRGYNNKILIADNLRLGVNKTINVTLEHHISHKRTPPTTSTKKVVPTKKVTTTSTSKHMESHHKEHSKVSETKTSHEDEKIALILAITTGFTIWYLFR